MQRRFGAWMRIAVYGLVSGLCCSAGSAQIMGGTAGAVKTAAPSSAKDVARTPDASEFDVATIKPGDPAECCGQTWGLDGMSFSTVKTNLRWLIRFAYGVNNRQIVGGPAWMGQDAYDMTGRFEGTKPPTNPQYRTALQKLLADRFQLKFHHEGRDMSAYVLSVERGGAKLTRSDPKESEPQLGFHGAPGATMYGTGRDISLHDFIGEIQRLVLDRPVVDRTGITGTYDIDLQFTREDANALGMMELPDNAAPNLLTALNQQLGLKLKVEKTPVDVMVIDRAEPPSAN